jgi:hypothetical protein
LKNARAEQRLDHDQLGDAGAAGEDQDRQRHVQARPHAVGADHDPAPALAAEAVGPHPAEQDQRDQRQGLCGQHEAQVGGRPGPLGHVQRQRDDHHLVADARRRLAQEQVSEVGEAQDAQVLLHGDCLSSLRRVLRTWHRGTRGTRARLGAVGRAQMNGMASIGAGR